MNNTNDSRGITQPRFLAHVIRGMIDDRIRRTPEPHQRVQQVTQRYPDRQITGGGSPELVQTKDGPGVWGVAGQFCKVNATADGWEWGAGSAPGAGAIIHRGSTVATGGVWEAVTGLTNGINVRYDTAAAYKAGSLNVFINGQQVIPVQDYDETTPATGRFDMVEAPTPIDTVSVIYEEP